jgi:hypothetical protein
MTAMLSSDLIWHCPGVCKLQHVWGICVNPLSTLLCSLEKIVPYKPRERMHNNLFSFPVIFNLNLGHHKMYCVQFWGWKICLASSNLGFILCVYETLSCLWSFFKCFSVSMIAFNSCLVMDFTYLWFDTIWWVSQGLAHVCPEISVLCIMYKCRM